MRNNHEKNIRIYTEELENAPDEGFWHLSRGIEYAALNDLESSKSDLENAVIHFSNRIKSSEERIFGDGSTYTFRALTYIELELIPKAESDFKKASHIVQRTRRDMITKDGVGLHTLRHSYATLMLVLGVDVKDVSRTLGHSKVAITYDTYSHVIAGAHRKASSKFEETLKESSSIWI